MENDVETTIVFWGYIGYWPPALTSSWIIIITGLCIALNGTPNIDCYWEGAIPKGYIKP